MAQTFSVELAGISATPVIKAASAAYGARLQRFRATVLLTAQAIADTVVLAIIPAGFAFAFGILNTDTSLATATIAIGNATTSTKYKAAAVFTATNTPTLFGNAAPELAAGSTADETVLLTVSTAALPGAGNLIVDLFFSRE